MIEKLIGKHLRKIAYRSMKENFDNSIEETLVSKDINVEKKIIMTKQIKLDLQFHMARAGTNVAAENDIIRCLDIAFSLVEEQKNHEFSCVK